MAVKPIALALFAFLLAGDALASPVPRAKPTSVPAQPTADIIATHPVSGAFGYIIVDADTGAVIDEGNADRLFIPASLSKTTAALRALDRFRPGARFQTSVAADGPITNGTLDGDLYLIGGGDPVLDTADLKQLAQEVRARGISKVTGRFLFDDGIAPEAPRISNRQAEQAGYNPSVSGLNLNFNRVRARWWRKNGKLTLRAEAQADGAKAPAPSIALRLGNDFAHRTTADGEEWALPRNALRRAGSRWLPSRRPALYAASTFRYLARKEGIRLPTPQRGTAPTGAQTVTTLESPVIDEIAADMMRYSTNLTAEALGIAAATQPGAQPLTIAAAARDTEAWMRANDLETDWNGLSLDNHSGLSSASRATPRQMVGVARLGHAMHGSRFEQVLYDEVLGRDGLRIHRKFAPSYGLRAKSGTMHFVRGLSGILIVDGKRYFFAVMAEESAQRAQVDAAFRRYNEAAPRGARSWLRKALRRESAVLRNWVYRVSSQNE